MGDHINQKLHMELKSVSDIRIDDINKYLFEPAFTSMDYPNHKYVLRDLLGTQHIISKKVSGSEFFDHETHVFESRALAEKFLEIRCDKFVLDDCSSGGLMIYSCPHGTGGKKCSAYARYYTKSHMVHVNFIHDQHDHTVGQSRFNQLDIAILRTFNKYFWRKNRPAFWNIHNIIYCMKRWFAEGKRALEFLSLYDFNVIWEEKDFKKPSRDELSKTVWHYEIYECEKRTTHIPYPPADPPGELDWRKFKGFKSEEWDDVDDNVWIERDNRHDFSFNISGKAFHMAKHMLEIMDNFVRLGYAFTYSNDTFNDWLYLKTTNLPNFQEWDMFYSEGFNIVTHVEYRGLDCLIDWTRNEIVDVNRRVLKEFHEEDAIVMLNNTIPFVEKDWNMQRTEVFRRRIPFPTGGVAVMPSVGTLHARIANGLRKTQPMPEIVIFGKYMNTDSCSTFIPDYFIQEYNFDLSGKFERYVHMHFRSKYTITTLNAFGLRQRDLLEEQQDSESEEGSFLEDPLEDLLKSCEDDTDEEEDYFSNRFGIETNPRIYGVSQPASDVFYCTVSDQNMRPKVQTLEQYFTEINNYCQAVKDVYATEEIATNQVQVKKLFTKKPANLWTTFGVSPTGFVPSRFYRMTGIPLKQNLAFRDARRQEKVQEGKQEEKQKEKQEYEQMQITSIHYFPDDDLSSYVSSAGEYMFPDELDEPPVVEPKKKSKNSKKKSKKNKYKK